ncbi:hypothetical protein GGG17_10570 [Arsenicicoccus sp. MKL-02]|uniref:Uncharacterized protein n=1 Tax=Arsenicicoccus cauae TaxID=2663847 RepID=A0A6I3I8A8_9MICO|nr:hypothetical protein [Arsenicicoccus cauae]MTB72404.1 hypothetical protein [Arsenicicoccus cauae]
MERWRWSIRCSRLLDPKLRDVAVDVEDTGGLPEGGWQPERPRGDKPTPARVSH